MGSSKNQTINLENGSAITTGFGTAGGTGWVSEPMGVRNVKDVTLNFYYDGAGVDLTLRFEGSSKARIDVAADDFDVIQKVDAGAASDDEVTKTLVDEDKLSIKINTEALEVLRISAKGASAVGDLTAEASAELVHSKSDFDIHEVS